uniref:LysR substrate-binding domain-containing protein n=1 Tax=Halomonas sp. TaxID=1486246 RepID=UPI002616EDFB|nr:LysR substrate-binding domain-containing protein [Halomonas sp.]
MSISYLPLRALVAFEASVRHASFKQAAKELNISPGAVSQQIRKLEDWLGYPLFQREVRQVCATESALEYYARIAPSLHQIRRASEACRKRDSHSVCLSLTPALAAKWLGPRIGCFIATHPGIDLSINSVSHPVDFHNEAVDLAIRHFDGHDNDLETRLLHHDEVQAFCSPDYCHHMQLKEPNDIAKAVLLNISTYVDWREWLQQCTTLEADAKHSIRALQFDQALLAIDAAKRGQGLVLSNALLVHDELKHGELIAPFEQSLSQDKGYYLVHPRQQPLSPAARLLKHWLLDQFNVGAEVSPSG